MPGKHSAAYSDAHLTRRSPSHSPADAASSACVSEGTPESSSASDDPCRAGCAAGGTQPPVRRARLGVVAAGSAGALGTAGLLLALVHGLGPMPWGPEWAGAEAREPAGPTLVAQGPPTPVWRAETLSGSLATSPASSAVDRRVLGDVAVADGAGGRAAQAQGSARRRPRPHGGPGGSAGKDGWSGPPASGGSVSGGNAREVPARRAPLGGGGGGDAAETVGDTVDKTVRRLGRTTKHLIGGTAGMTGIGGGGLAGGALDDGGLADALDGTGLTGGGLPGGLGG